MNDWIATNMHVDYRDGAKYMYVHAQILQDISIFVSRCGFWFRDYHIRTKWYTKCLANKFEREHFVNVTGCPIVENENFHGYEL